MTGDKMAKTMYWHRVAEGSDKEFLRRLIYIARKDSIEPKLCINKIMQIPLKVPNLGRKADYVKFNETAEEAERILEILSRAESDIGKARIIVAGYMAREKMAMEQASDYGIVKGESK